MCVCKTKQRKDKIMALENLKDFDRTLFGTKVLNWNTQKLGIVLYTWTNVYADGEIPFATCVDENGKKYNIAMDSITAVENLDNNEIQ